MLLEKSAFLAEQSRLLAALRLAPYGGGPKR